MTRATIPTTFALAVLGLAAAAPGALAKHGADDGASHHTSAHHRTHHHHRHAAKHRGDDHRGGRHGGGADDGANHR